MDKESLKEVVVSQKKLFLAKEGLFWRDILNGFYQKYHKTNEALIITGVRRCGKSSLLRLIWDEYKNREKLSDEQVLYINFEDERLIEFTKNDFSKLIESFFELYDFDRKKKIFLLLDEIQNVRYWEKWISRTYEENKYRIFITGSNATLLSSELTTSLTGRNIPITLWPLTFREYLVNYKKYNLTKSSSFDQEERIRIERHFSDYVRFGGMPAYIKTRSIELIQEYFKDIISRDIVNRYHVKYKQELRELAHLLLANLGQIQSLKNISRSVEIKNLSTVKNYLTYLENSFLFKHLSLFSYSLKRQIFNPDKFYSVDIAFFHNIAFKNSDNMGAVYENIVFSQFMVNPMDEIYYYRSDNGYEVDFVLKRKNKIEGLYQVCYEFLSEKTIEREERSLWEAMAELQLKEGVILNREISKTVKRGANKIHYIPLWKWLLAI